MFQVPVDGKRGIGFVSFENSIHRSPRRSHFRGFERSFAMDWSKTAGHQQEIPHAQRHLQPLGEQQQQVAASRRSTGFDEAQMPGRDAGFAGEIELAELPSLPPVAKQVADTHLRGDRSHAGLFSRIAAADHYLAGNRFASPTRSSSQVPADRCGRRE
jgi:hypothetical protein